MDIDENMSAADDKIEVEAHPISKVQQNDGDVYNATYSFRDEDHTLGNLLRN